MRFLFSIMFICTLAWGQGARGGRQASGPAPQTPPEIADIVNRINREAEAAMKAEKEFAALLEKPGVDAAQAKVLVDRAEASVGGIKKLLDQLDARYEALSEDQRSVVRQAWTISMLLGAFIGNQRDSLEALRTEDGRKESQTNAQCAVRRATMLEETLRGLTR